MPRDLNAHSQVGINTYLEDDKRNGGLIIRSIPHLETGPQA
jgi:hypothetical protein